MAKDANDLSLFSAADLIEGYNQLSFTPLEVAEVTLRRIEARDHQVHAYVSIDPSVSLAAAKASTQRYRDRRPLSALDGVPFGVKDIIATKDFPTAFGSRATFQEPWLRDDAPVVARLKEAGAVLMGKTATPELAAGGVCDTVFASTRNPWNLERTSGGSSGGAAAAAAMGMGPIQIGTDSGGSIRIPASFCGVVGFKATLDRVPDWPWTAQSPLYHVGPLTRTVTDAALALSIIARADPRVATRLPPLGSLGPKVLNGGVKGLRLGLLTVEGDPPIEPDVQRLFNTAVRALEAGGAIIEPMTIDTPNLMALVPIVESGIAAMIDRLPGGERALLEDRIRAILKRRDSMTVAKYAQCLESREAFADRVNEHFSRFDALISPTMPITAFRAGQQAPFDGLYAGAARGEWTPFTPLFNLSRNPAATIPIGLSQDGLPAGAQIVGALYREDTVLRIARTLERALAATLWPPLALQTNPSLLEPAL
jgi:aspartyl-tRNA(Asn)/glutamyl-tRNA(Gln) amidotransferase subunit A